MSNKTQLQTNNTALGSLITRVNAAKDVAASLPEAGGSSGGVETCTVNIISETGYIAHYGVTQYIDGSINNINMYWDENYPTNLVFNNVVCGSFLYFYSAQNFIIPRYSTTNGSIVNNLGQDWMVSVTSSTNAVETITIWDDD